MKALIYVTGFLISATLSGFVFADETAYRLAGIISPTDTHWMAIIEMPNRIQQLVHEGDTVGEARVLRITKEEVILELKDSTRILRLASSDVRREPPETTKGLVYANQFLALIKQTPGLMDSDGLPGLDDMSRLPDDARIMTINGIKMTSPGAGLRIVQQAIDQGSLVRITLEEGAAVPIIYLRPGTEVVKNESM